MCAGLHGGRRKPELRSSWEEGDLEQVQRINEQSSTCERPAGRESLGSSEKFFMMQTSLLFSQTKAKMIKVNEPH